MPGEGRGLALQLLKWNGQGRSQQIDGGGPETGVQQVQVAWEGQGAWQPGFGVEMGNGTLVTAGALVPGAFFMMHAQRGVQPQEAGCTE